MSRKQIQCWEGIWWSYIIPSFQIWKLRPEKPEYFTRPKTWSDREYSPSLLTPSLELYQQHTSLSYKNHLRFYFSKHSHPRFKATTAFQENTQMVSAKASLNNRFTLRVPDSSLLRVHFSCNLKECANMKWVMIKSEPKITSLVWSAIFEMNPIVFLECQPWVLRNTILGSSF